MSEYIMKRSEDIDKIIKKPGWYYVGLGLIRIILILVMIPMMIFSMMIFYLGRFLIVSSELISKLITKILKTGIFSNILNINSSWADPQKAPGDNIDSESADDER